MLSNLTKGLFFFFFTILKFFQKAIEKNEQIIKDKRSSNQAIDSEYHLSAQKEEEIKQAFEKIKKETGIHDSKENESKELLSAFVTLFQKVLEDKNR